MVVYPSSSVSWLNPSAGISSMVSYSIPVSWAPLSTSISSISVCWNRNWCWTWWGLSENVIRRGKSSTAIRTLTRKDSPDRAVTLTSAVGQFSRNLAAPGAYGVVYTPTAYSPNNPGHLDWRLLLEGIQQSRGMHYARAFRRIGSI
jgi:hypothetical protein